MRHGAYIWLAHCVETQESIHYCLVTLWLRNARCLISLLKKSWLVALHQDLSISVKARVDGPECSGWSEKEGQVYVQPPVSVLEQLVAVRVHLDECSIESGALRVVPKSHVEGRLNKEQAEALRSQNGEVVVSVVRGGVLVMRPLLLHASSKATSLNPRRVLHFVFGPPALPLGLVWRWAV